ncbi:MAG: hypothetical protein JWQ79_3178 [Mucilaginibacter sp.]|nr:hypothetical protein [Mucilaginibacter sp.]
MSSSKPLRWRLLLLLLLVLVVCRPARAQVVAIDTLTGTPSAPFPFDKPFPLKYPIPATLKATKVYLFKAGPDGCVENIYNEACRARNLNEWTLPELNARLAKVKDADRKTSIQQQIDAVKKNFATTVDPVWLSVTKQNGGDVYIGMPALEPNTGYKIYIFANPAKVDGIEDVLTSLKAKDIPKATAAYTKISKSYERRFQNPQKCQKCGALTFDVPEFEDFQNSYDADLAPLWDNVVTERATLDQKKKGLKFKPLTHDFDPKSDEIVKVLLGYDQLCSFCKDTIPQYQLLIKYKTDIVSCFVNLPNLGSEKVLQGYSDLAGFQSALIDKKIKPDAQAQNLTKTLMQLMAVKALIRYDRLMYVPDETKLKPFETFIDEVIAVYTDNLATLTAYQTDIAKQEDVVKKAETSLNTAVGKLFAVPINNVNSDTYTYSFDTRAGYYIKADFGFMVYGNPWNYAAFKGFLPYLGFHVNLRPMNTDIPFSQIPNKNLWSYLSLNAGVLVGSLAEQGKRDGLIGATSVYTGLGVNFSHEFRLTFGSVWFRQDDPNPLISKKSVGATPYVGLSMDLRLKDIYSSFKKLFEP